MDIAKYIGLFLLKNKYAYIHGLGHLELRKKPATYNGEALEPPSFEVVMTPVGSIDDALANFIATNEQVSISKAANALRDFSMQSKSDLQEGKEVVIPAIGKFVEENGKVSFITNPVIQYTPPAIPTLKVAPRKEEESIEVTKERVVAEQDGGESINWTQIAAWALGILALAAAVYFGVRYWNQHQHEENNPVIQTPAVDTSAIHTPIPIDSTQQGQPEANPVDSSLKISYKIQIGAPYGDLAKAKNRVDHLRGFGHKVELVAESDSSAYYIVLPVKNIRVADTSKLMDSLRRNFRDVHLFE